VQHGNPVFLFPPTFTELAAGKRPQAYIPLTPQPNPFVLSLSKGVFLANYEQSFHRPHYVCDFCFFSSRKRRNKNVSSLSFPSVFIGNPFVVILNHVPDLIRDQFRISFFTRSILRQAQDERVASSKPRLQW